jgi:hypothetical protein
MYHLEASRRAQRAQEAGRTLLGPLEAANGPQLTELLEPGLHSLRLAPCNGRVWHGVSTLRVRTEAELVAEASRRVASRSKYQSLDKVQAGTVWFCTEQLRHTRRQAYHQSST